MSNIENVIKFFGGNDGSISCKVTYTTLSDSDEVVLRDEPITLCLDGDGVVYMFMARKEKTDYIGRDGQCFGCFIPRWQEFEYNPSCEELTITGKGNGTKKDYRAVIRKCRE